jgi:hypothetical protein
VPEIAIRLEDRDNAPIIFVEADDAVKPSASKAGGPERAGLRERVTEAGAAVGGQMATISAEAFNASLESIPQMGDVVLEKIKAMRQRPREVEVTMSFKIGAKGNIKMVEANGEAHLLVTFRWDTTMDAE